MRLAGHAFCRLWVLWSNGMNDQYTDGRASAPLRDDRYLSLKTLAQYAGLSVRTLRSRLHDPAEPLTYFRIGGKILIKMSDYDAWALRFQQTHSATVSSVVDDVLDGII
jgi:lambda repressor-like predicted transcriptional regulator